MKLSDNFSLEELTRTDVRKLLEANRQEAECNEIIKGNLTRVCKELLEPLRELFKKPIKVNSGYRGTELNELVGGSKTSQHCNGEAADIVIGDIDTPEEQIEAIKKIVKELPDFKFGQLLQEHGCIHISLGTKKEIAYYDVTTKKKKPIQF